MTIRTVRWFVIGLGGALVALTIVAGAGSRTQTLRELVVDTLSERLDSDVELQYFSVDTFPTVRIRGEGLVLRHRGRRDVPPLIVVKKFAIDGGLLGLLQRPRRFRVVHLDDLQISIPPRGVKDRGSGQTPSSATTSEDGRDTTAGTQASMLVDRLEAHGASLALIPKKAGRAPRVFAVHALHIRRLGFGEPMPFTATLTNPLPEGLIETRGTFGPWRKRDPGQTNLTGTYSFDADLSTVKGIAGALKSTGKFGGQLERIDVEGETRTPDFRVTTGSGPVPLATTFRAVVDGTDGDTYLNAVFATFQQTSLFAKGAIVGTPGVKGRSIKLHVKIDKGRIEDVLRLAVKSDRPLLKGSVALHTDFDLPPGQADVMDRLNLAGEFDVDAGRFTNPEVQAKVIELSKRARGGADDEREVDVASDLRGKFRLDATVLMLQDTTFRIPGATVQIGGRYGLRTEQIEFDGSVRMNATVSQAAGGGAKSFFLKIVDPLFRKDGAGAVLPIKVRGTRQQPKFGVDVGRALRPGR
jgi:hypothetical protein